MDSGLCHPSFFGGVRQYLFNAKGTLYFSGLGVGASWATELSPSFFFDLGLSTEYLTNGLNSISVTKGEMGLHFSL